MWGLVCPIFQTLIRQNKSKKKTTPPDLQTRRTFMIIARTEDFCTLKQVSITVGPQTIIHRGKDLFSDGSFN